MGVNIISVANLQKHFQVAVRQRGTLGAIRGLFSHQTQTVRAVDGITFEIQAGELVGYLGPNGAGKSTTLKMLTGLLVPSAGDLWVDGRIPWRERQAYVGQIGAVFGQRTTLWWDLPVIESLDLIKYIYKIPEDRYWRNLTEFRRLLDLDEFIQRPVRSLSLGQRMRADLCAALLHDPKLVFLDEPTIGLDVVAKERIRQFIQHVNRQRGATVLLTTHDMSDVEKLCERVIIIDHGRLLYDGGLAQLKERFGGSRRLVVQFAERYPSVEVEGARLVERDEQQAVFEFERDQVAASDLITRLTARYQVRDLEVREPEIEATIRRIYEERLLED
jgi:ABC-2 type transport system ATP-binding protein